MKFSQLTVFLLFLSVAICAARDPLVPGIYSGAWMGPVGGGERTGNTARLNVFTNGEAHFAYGRVDPITGTPVIRVIVGRVIGKGVVRGHSGGRYGSSFRAVSQRDGHSARGWIRNRPSGSRLIFYVDYNSPAE